MLEFRGYTFNSSPTTLTSTGERSDSFWPESASKRRRRKKSPAEKRQARQGGTKARASKENFVAALHRCCSFCSFVRSFFLSFFLSFLPSFLPSFFLCLVFSLPRLFARSVGGTSTAPKSTHQKPSKSQAFTYKGGMKGSRAKKQEASPPSL